MPDPDSTPSVPLATGTAERALIELRRRRAAEKSGATATETGATALRHDSRGGWSRMAAILPLGLVVLLAMSFPLGLWSGIDSAKNLTYEDAFEVVFDDENYPNFEVRNSAMGRIVSEVLRGTKALQRCRGEQALAATVVAALKKLQTQAQPPATPAPINFPSGDLSTVVATIDDQTARDEDRIAAIQILVNSTPEAFALIYEVERRGGVLGRHATRALARIRRLLR